MKRNLTATTIKKATLPEDAKELKLTDGGGLYLLIRRNSRLWRYNYRYFGKQKTLSIGSYPEISLKEAREKHEQAREQLEKGIDPSLAKQQHHLNRVDGVQNSLKVVAEAWFAQRANGIKDNNSKGEFVVLPWSDSHRKRVRSFLDNDIYPYIGHKPIREVNKGEFVAVCERKQDSGAVVSARKLGQVLFQIFTFADQRGFIDKLPVASLKGMLLKPVEKHHAAIIEPVKVGGLLRAIDGYSSFQTRKALQLLALVFT